MQKINLNKNWEYVPVQVSKTFFAWVVGMQGKMRILSQQSVCEHFNEFVAKLKEEH